MPYKPHRISVFNLKLNSNILIENKFGERKKRVILCLELNAFYFILYNTLVIITDSTILSEIIMLKTKFQSHI